jgi:hypothetical protein
MAALSPGMTLKRYAKRLASNFLAITIDVSLAKPFKDLRVILRRTYDARLDLAAYPHFRLR